MLKLKAMMILAMFVFCSTAIGEMLFVDDFEDDVIGSEPLRWDKIESTAGDSIITIEIDPTDAQNKVAKTTAIGIYLPQVAGRENWTDYVWDFDWMWENDNFVGTVYRVESGEAFFHASRRTGFVNVNIYTYDNGAWAEITSGEYPNENNVWYSHRLIINGNTHQVYLKERDDDTPFEELDPVVEAENDMFESGPIGMMGITSGVSYYDNMRVAETVQDLEDVTAVNADRKLAAIWGQIKK
ncbi:hypothetical protein GF312_05585 [Candidatus Poribacteria bacterium]|nr:hypothetical protein [Candidatus Poribacteria bacterium]